MLVLDTNVISEAMRGPRADHNVQRWLRSLTTRPVTTLINRMEIMTGLELLPPGQRKDAHAVAANQALRTMGVILPLTTEAADLLPQVVAIRRRRGRPIEAMDALIAAICLSVGGTLATRDTAGFEGLGLELVNPWVEVGSR